MLPTFQYFGFVPELSFQNQAERLLDQTLNIYPFGTVAVALFDKTDHGYRCAVNLYTKYGPIIAETVQSTAYSALQHVIEVLTVKAKKWNHVRSQQLNLNPTPSFHSTTT